MVGYTCFAVQAKTEFDNCQVIRETLMRLMRGPDAGECNILVDEQELSKNRDKLIDFTDRVSG